ncbi:MAG TPA: hypothetical protein VFZ64_03550 [Nocardioidaceae bacterium]
MVQIAWLVLGGTALVASLFARRDRRALYLARAALGVLYIGAGALVHAVNLVRGVSYADFADAAHLAYVRDTWASVVVPETGLFIGLLTIFEATVGILILAGGRWTELGLWMALVMHVGLLVFGWVITVWSILMLVTVTLLLRAEQEPPATPATAHWPSSGHLPHRA